MQGQEAEERISINYQTSNIKKIKNILFDLDGTLTDSRAGITNSYLSALKQLGLTESNRESVIQYIGQPLHKYFEERHSLRGAEIKKAVTLYREYYSVKGIYENKLFDGICELLQNINNESKRVFLVTGKPLRYAREILRHFDIEKYFVNSYGSGLGTFNSSKEELLSLFIGEEKPDISSTVMIGDTKYDVLGAKYHGMKSIAVTYGFGVHNEILESNPDLIAGSVEELSGILLQ